MRTNSVFFVFMLLVVLGAPRVCESGGIGIANTPFDPGTWDQVDPVTPIVKAVEQETGGRYNVTIYNRTRHRVNFTINGDVVIAPSQGGGVTYRGKSPGKARISFYTGRGGSRKEYNLDSGHDYYLVDQLEPSIGASAGGHFLELFEGTGSDASPGSPDLALANGSGWLPGGAGAMPQTILVTFTNRTRYNVGFSLNGGRGLGTSLSPGRSQSFNMVVDRGIQPAVTISQPTGGLKSFWVANNGRYAFSFQNGSIVNAFQ